jgi:serine/threonine-protein kinase
MAVGAVPATMGVYTIGQLRRAAFEARQLGQYRLRQRLGGGGMGEVFLAEHQLMKRPCAIKVIRPDKAGDPKVLARFEREVQITAQLSHWNSIEIFDYGRTDDGTFFYVMEYLPGMSLDQLIERHGPQPASRVIYLLRQVCDALREAHGMGLIHRDIKPANIFAAQRGGQYDVAKLLDFGMVKPVVSGFDAAPLTQEGAITGSPLFMAPEQATGSEPDARTDIYSTGAVAYQLLTGRPPFVADNPLKVLLAQVQQPPEPPSELNPQVPADLEEVVLRCLAKEPRDRYPDVVELAAALDNCSDAHRWTPEDAARWWQEQALVGVPAAPSSMLDAREQVPA